MTQSTLKGYSGCWGELAPLEQEWMWLEGNGGESGMAMPLVVSNGQIGIYVEGRAGRTCSWT